MAKIDTFFHLMYEQKASDLHLSSGNPPILRINGELHRVDGPAYEHPDGTKAWFLNGRLHRVDGPAYEHPDGDKYWYLDGKRHRVDGPAAERSSGTKEWWLDGKRWDANKQPHNKAGQVWWVMAKMSGAK